MILNSILDLNSVRLTTLIKSLSARDWILLCPRQKYHIFKNNIFLIIKLSLFKK